MKILLALALMFPVTAAAQSIEDDGPWITVSDDLVWDASTYGMDDIIEMANLDDDPTVISSDEQEMIELLMQVLGVNPVGS